MAVFQSFSSQHDRPTIKSSSKVVSFQLSIRSLKILHWVGNFVLRRSDHSFVITTFRSSEKLKMSESYSIETLPEEIWIDEIFCYFELHDLIWMSQTSKYFDAMISRERHFAWRSMLCGAEGLKQEVVARLDKMNTLANRDFNPFKEFCAPQHSPSIYFFRCLPQSIRTQWWCIFKIADSSGYWAKAKSLIYSHILVLIQDRWSILIFSLLVLLGPLVFLALFPLCSGYCDGPATLFLTVSYFWFTAALKGCFPVLNLIYAFGFGMTRSTDEDVLTFMEKAIKEKWEPISKYPEAVLLSAQRELSLSAIHFCPRLSDLSLRTLHSRISTRVLGVQYRIFLHLLSPLLDDSLQPTSTRSRLALRPCTANQPLPLPHTGLGQYLFPHDEVIWFREKHGRSNSKQNIPNRPRSPKSGCPPLPYRCGPQGRLVSHLYFSWTARSPIRLFCEEK